MVCTVGWKDVSTIGASLPITDYRRRHGIMQRERVIECKGIVKQFPGVLAVNGVDFTAYRGCVHAVVGENGAGKTTLMKILYGLEKEDQGIIDIRGKTVNINSASDAIKYGIGMVHQHFMLIPSYTVTENIILGQEVLKRGLLDLKTARSRVQELSDKYGLKVDPDAKIRDIPVGIRQRVEILKLLYRGLDILIFDEPTAVLTPQEVTSLFAIIKALVNDGKTVILITHKLREVMEISDYVTVLRRGKLVGNRETNDVSIEELAEMMVGRKMLTKIPKPQTSTNRKILHVKKLNVKSRGGLSAVKDVSIVVNSGEIVTVAGIEGNGQTELAEAIFGLRPIVSGDIELGEKSIVDMMIRERRDEGIGFVPEDRMEMGLSLDALLDENFIIGKYHRKPYSERGLLNFTEIRKHSVSLVDSYDIRIPAITARASTLSGGNLQKIVVSREFSSRAKFYVVAQPTRGLDVGSQEFIYQQIIGTLAEGAGVLLFSTDLDEVFLLSDRIVVLYQGEITGEFSPQEVTREELGLYMTGIKRTEPSEGGGKS